MSFKKILLIGGALVILFYITTPLVILGGFMKGVLDDENAYYDNSAKNFLEFINHQEEKCSSRSLRPSLPKLSAKTCRCIIQKSVNYVPLPNGTDLPAYIQSNTAPIINLNAIPTSLLEELFFRGKTLTAYPKVKIALLRNQTKETLEATDFQQVMDSLPMYVMKAGIGDCAPRDYFTDFDKFQQEEAEYFIIEDINTAIYAVKKRRKKLGLHKSETNPPKLR